MTLISSYLIYIYCISSILFAFHGVYLYIRGINLLVPN